MMNSQLIQISERIRDHLIKQNQQSSDESGECFYRGPTGLMCAVGALIHDEFYDQEFEYNSFFASEEIQQAVFDSLMKDGIVIQDDQKQETVDLLQQWQEYHDGRYNLWIRYGEEYNSPQCFNEKIMEQFQ